MQPLSLMCSIPYFNSLTPEEITTLVGASQRETLRPGESKSLSCTDPTKAGDFFIIISGNLALAKAVVENAKAVKQAELLPSMKLGIGDFFAIHTDSEMKVIAMEPVEYLVIPMHVIAELSPSSSQQIQAETNDMACEASEVCSFSFLASLVYIFLKSTLTLLVNVGNIVIRRKATSSGRFSSRSRVQNASSHLRNLGASRNAR